MLLSDVSSDGNDNDDLWGSFRRKRKKPNQQSSRSDEEAEAVTDFKVVLKLVKEDASFGKFNPLKLSSEINKLIGNIKCAKTLRDGSLLIVCTNEKDKEKALKIEKILGERVSGKTLDRKTYVCGVISGIPPEVPTEEIKANMKGGKVVDVKRLKASRNGERVDSFSVMIKLDEKVLPGKMYIGFMSYDVRQYIPPPLRCFKCQKFGHVAAICKGKQKCGRCAGEHEYGQCEEGAKIKCINCGGEHSSAYRGCEASKRAAEVQKIKVTTGVTYAEAARKVPVVPKKVSVTPLVSKSNPPCLSCRKINDDTLIIEKEAFLLFVADVINCSVQAKGNTERIRIIVKAAERYLGISNVGHEIIIEGLRARKDLQESQTCSGAHSS